MGNLDNSFLFIRSIRLKDDIEPKAFESFPLNIDALRYFVSLRFTTPVTIFNGENGCGKSTLIEALASLLDMPIMGGNNNLRGIFENYDIGEEKSSELANYLLCDKGFKRPSYSFFFRAESFYKIADIIVHDSKRSMERGDGPTINKYAYGDKDLLLQSHGESFMDFMQHQLSKNGLFILDEPEAALSPQNQLKLMAIIDHYAKQGSQFIIATHSPFILGYREARIINLDDGMHEIDFKQTKIYNLYRHFLDNPEDYQKKMFDEDDY